MLLCCTVHSAYCVFGEGVQDIELADAISRLQREVLASMIREEQKINKKLNSVFKALIVFGRELKSYCVLEWS